MINPRTYQIKVFKTFMDDETRKVFEANEKYEAQKAKQSEDIDVRVLKAKNGFIVLVFDSPENTYNPIAKYIAKDSAELAQVISTLPKHIK